MPDHVAQTPNIGVGPALPWGRSERGAVKRALIAPLPAAAVGLVVAALLAGAQLGLLLTGAFCGYALWVTIDHGTQAARRRKQRGESTLQATSRSFIRAPRLVGAYLAHFGFIMTFAAIAVSSTFQTEVERTLGRGESMQLGGYQMTYEDSRIEEREPGGLGLHLIRSIVDKLEYEYGGRKMRVTASIGLEH